jgi:threonylcarbamoyladenosine tRNA methylthiotransferase MtaB
MRRPYTFEEYKARIEYIRKEVPGVSVSSDIITGFPGETGELFEESVRNIRDAKLSFLHVFPFSVRKGTRAETMPNHVDGGTKKARVRRLTNLSHELYNDFMKTKLQSFSSVYIEQKITGMWFGHSSDYLPVYVKSDLDLKGKFVDVRLISVGRDGMIGELI